MTAALPLGEPKSAEDGAQFIVSDGLVGRSAEEVLQSFAVSSHPANLAFARTLALSNAKAHQRASQSNAAAPPLPQIARLVQRHVRWRVAIRTGSIRDGARRHSVATRRGESLGKTLRLSEDP